MNSKSILILVLFLLWSAGSWHWYTCKVKGLCGDSSPHTELVQPHSEPTPETDITKPLLNSPLYFNWSNAQAQLGDKFVELKDRLMAGIVGDRVLEITGLYHPDEENNSSYENLGWARAHAVKNLLAEHLDTSRVVLAARSLTAQPERMEGFEAVDFSFPVRSEFVQEYNQRILIYFPFNSTEEQLDPSIISYLQDLVTRVKADQKSLSITGHTDDIGNAAANFDLGLARAKSIQDLLIKMGLEAHKIQTSSAGEDQPMASNATAEGRKKNRRIELTIN